MFPDRIQFYRLSVDEKTPRCISRCVGAALFFTTSKHTEGPTEHQFYSWRLQTRGYMLCAAFWRSIERLLFMATKPARKRSEKWLGLIGDLLHLRLRYHRSAFRVHEKVEENRRHAEDPGRQSAEWRKWNVFTSPYQEIEQIQFVQYNFSLKKKKRLRIRSLIKLDK